MEVGWYTIELAIASIYNKGIKVDIISCRIPFPAKNAECRIGLAINHAGVAAWYFNTTVRSAGPLSNVTILCVPYAETA
jgi:hypothetical protein